MKFIKNENGDLELTPTAIESDVVLSALDVDNNHVSGIDPSEVRIQFITEEEAKALYLYNKTSIAETDEAVYQKKYDHQTVIDQLKEVLYVLVKGSTVVGKLFPNSDGHLAQIRYKSISKLNEGQFQVNGLELIVDKPGVYYIVANIRGYETSFIDQNARIVILEEKSVFERIFAFIESFFAYVIATMIVISAANGFPTYLKPISLLLIALFLFYVWGQKKTKGENFVYSIYVMLLSSAVILIWILVKKFSPI